MYFLFYGRDYDLIFCGYIRSGTIDIRDVLDVRKGISITIDNHLPGLVVNEDDTNQLIAMYGTQGHNVARLTQLFRDRFYRFEKGIPQVAVDKLQPILHLSGTVS